MRLFTAIDLPPEVVRRLDGLITGLRPSARLHWSPARNLHITTKFIGEWPEARLAELVQALGSLAPNEPIWIEVRGLGFFPNPRAPRVFWAGVHAPPNLAELARQTDRALHRLGVPLEPRPFSPHLTLARIKEPIPLDRLHASLAALPSTEFGAFTAASFHLYQSKLNPSGSVYTRLAEFPLHA
jgi:2'-5' RNA ligase